jgi:hypothetical protein
MINTPSTLSPSNLPTSPSSSLAADHIHALQDGAIARDSTSLAIPVLYCLNPAIAGWNRDAGVRHQDLQRERMRDSSSSTWWLWQKWPGPRAGQGEHTKY